MRRASRLGALATRAWPRRARARARAPITSAATTPPIRSSARTRALPDRAEALSGLPLDSIGSVALLSSPARVRVTTPDGDRLLDLGVYPEPGPMVTRIDAEGSRDVTAGMTSR
jgi:hypothetical protein